MSAPSTPQKQAQPVKLEQLLPTPPPTAVARKETTHSATHHFHEPGPHVRRLTYDVTQKVEKVDESSDPTLYEDDSVKQAHTQQLDKNGRPQNEVKLWLSSPSDPDERQRRFDIFLHGLLPSDEEFNLLRSNEVWEPKIGEEGIENEQDIRIVLKAREEQRVRSEAFKKHDSDSDWAFESDNEEDDEISKLTV
ncbi:hypothetical protein F4680DRAFT_444283 [Xylaria scruposa]|nr:hypothetical protein F4680DRAFT_444283 [Xylaria scruposa]